MTTIISVLVFMVFMGILALVATQLYKLIDFIATKSGVDLEDFIDKKVL